MKRLLRWWYRLSLPRNEAGESATPQNPIARERVRYARLTSGFLLLLIAMFLPAGTFMIFDSPPGSSSPAIAWTLLAIVLASFFAGRAGLQRLSASGIVLYIMFQVTTVLATNPLDPVLFSIVNALLFAVLFAGSLLPPVAAIFVGTFNCVIILLLAFFAPHTAAYTETMGRGLYSVLVFLPVALQIGIGIIVYVIMNNLISTLRRADRAEEIVSLQQAVAEHEELRQAQQAQLEEGLKKIALVHARVANGDLDARVSLTEGDVLWSVAIPLNNLLKRLQTARQTEQQYQATLQGARAVAQQLHAIRTGRQTTPLPPTGSILDPVVLEINAVLRAYLAQNASTRTS